MLGEDVLLPLYDRERPPRPSSGGLLEVVTRLFRHALKRGAGHFPAGGDGTNNR